MADEDLRTKRPALDPNARVILGRQLRDYYDRMRQTTVSESLAQLLHQFELNSVRDNERPASPQAGIVPQNS